MRRSLTVSAVVLFVLIAQIEAAAAAADFAGQIARVQGDRLLIAPSPGATFQEGEPVEIIVQIDGVGEAQVATGAILSMLDKSAVAEVQEATGRLVVGQQVRSLAAELTAQPPAAPVPDASETTKVWMGAFVREVYRDQALQAGLEHPFGVVVVGILDDSPASRQGLQVGDLLLTRNGKEIASTITWQDAQDQLRPGAVIRLEILRAGKQQTLQLEPEATPGDAEIFRRVKAAAERGAPWALYALGDRLQSGRGVPADKLQAVEWFRRASGGGELLARVRLGKAYESGTGVARDNALAATHYRTAAEAGHPEAQAALGALYWRGDGVAQDYKESLSWIRRSAEQGCATGEEWLAYFYDEARGAVKKDPAEAARWYLSAAVQGTITAQMAMVRRYASGTGVPRDDAEAQRWYRTVTETLRCSGKINDPWAQAWLGKLHFTGEGVPQNHIEAARLYHAAAKNGHAEAARSLAAMYNVGIGVLRDDQEALKWFRAAADGGDSIASNDLGCLYSQGRGVPQDHAEALRWYRKAADKGEPMGMANIGLAYEEGRGVAKNLTQAFQWQHRAAKLNCPFAQYQVGRMIAEGKGVRKDLPAAVGWIRLAADQGEARAQYHLGWMYQNGQGLPTDVAEAVRWYQKAAAQGNESAIKQLKDLG